MRKGDALIGRDRPVLVALALLMFIALALPAVAQGADTGPFGLRMGQYFTAGDMDGPGESLWRWNRRYAVHVPVPRPEFVHYTATVPLDRGLCEISGLGERRSREDVWAAFLRLADALTAAYGASERPIERVMPVFDAEYWRHMSARPALSATWKARRGRSFAGSVKSIRLTMTYHEVSQLSISYEFANGCPSVFTQGISLIVARVTSVSAPSPSADCTAPTCFELLDHSFETVQVLAGEPVPPRIDYAMIPRQQLLPGETVVLLVDRHHTGAWSFRDYTRVQRGRACLATEWLRYHEIVPPRPAWREGTRTCFRVGD